MKNNRRWAVPLFPLRGARWMVAGLSTLAILGGCSTQAPVATNGDGWRKDQVADAYVFGYPLVASDLWREKTTGGDASKPGQAAVNTLRHTTALPPVGATGRPSVDTLESSAWLDVSSGPVLVSLPALSSVQSTPSGTLRGRYFDARAFDTWTNVIYSSIGAAPAVPAPVPKKRSKAARMAAEQASILAFVTKGYTGPLPDGVTRVETPTRYAWLSIRVRVNGQRDVREARKLQTAMRIEAPPADKTSPTTAGAAWPNVTANTPAVVPSGDKAESLDATAYFTRLAKALEDNPPVPDDPHAVTLLAQLGVKAGEPVQFRPSDSALLATGLADGRARVDTVPSNALSRNGWVWFGDAVGNYGTDYTLRAFLAKRQPASGTKDDEVKPVAFLDSDAHPLNGANTYVLHFAPNQLPPVRGFWTLTAYTKEGALIDDKALRLSLSDRDRLKKNRDGSTDVVVSATSPGKARVSNWLPAPDGDFQLMMRLYAPKPEATSGAWAPPAIERQ
ncbi:hypothetical protein AX768_29620 [Burkholderia sp. PAMC 28687]|uniref:DUF1254 domain-containing protein n=1 Tax=Burkholderia sp. PAMC 28687 TaxID=1795874 RepID=UPI000786275C|nr:DUF1214 domain-containing protein [Burkholderia sp. PAMC 28687]AMM18252.1 hypothetical protein AX768_29620 [Burkholderia sp. PAMC 28687]